jgi:hypothetical protein
MITELLRYRQNGMRMIASTKFSRCSVLGMTSTGVEARPFSALTNVKYNGTKKIMAKTNAVVYQRVVAIFFFRELDNRRDPLLFG